MTDMQFPGLFDLKGKVAVITGGSRGIGLHTATAFLHAGCRKVILVSRKPGGPQGLDQAVEKLNALSNVHGEAVAIAADLSKPAECERVVKEIQKMEDKIDILIPNAAATWGGPFDTTPDHAVQKVLDLNVRSIFNLVRLMIPLLEKAGRVGDPARIVIVGAGAGNTVPFQGEHSIIAYGVSKAAAHHLARYLAVELGPRNIATNAIAPGFFPSKLANGLVDILGGFDAMAKANLLGRVGEPEDIAGVMLFLCSKAGSWVNGAVLEVDGGSHLAANRSNDNRKAKI